MAIAEIKPRDQEKLKRMVQDSIPGQEKQLAADVRGEFEKATAGSWRVCKEGVLNLPIPPSCIVYIIIGTCKVGEEILSEPNLGEAEVGYLITGETSIQLQKETIVIFFKY
ncbi:hypothetical protein V490_00917 [Pseudogymnoascus sp. VKM F-3557]|nr:hypothetical protein V490_00917 [Pseudogymnoascus sp. VKM F-3557]